MPTEHAGWPPIDPADGWARLLTALQRDLERIDPGLVVRQVKQKGGVLEVWVEASSPQLADAVHDRIASAREQSARTCERCGQPGQISQGADGWYRALCASHAAEAGEPTVEVPTDPVTTAWQLRALLEGVPDDTPILTDGYEGGYTTIADVSLVEVHALDRDRDQAEYLGPYETVEEAQRQAALSPDDPEIAIGGIAPPRLVGEPVTALILTREGR